MEREKRKGRRQTVVYKTAVFHFNIEALDQYIYDFSCHSVSMGITSKSLNNVQVLRK